MSTSFPAALEPTWLWKNFDLLRSTPRCSGAEAAVRSRIESWAEGHGFATRTDAVGNLVVVVPATPGREDRPVTVIQGHLDMVCEKNADVDFDFATDPLDVYLDGDWLTARGTTLGADNGIGVATAMAVAEDPDAVHGPLELLMTVDEETGMTGAWGLKPGFLTGPRMLNLDTEEEGAIYVGCSGGGDVITRFRQPTEAVPPGYAGCRVAVKGLVGGHSGLDIHENRANALKSLGRVLQRALDAGLILWLRAVDGGSKRNAIPREAVAALCLPADQLDTLRGVVDAVAAELSAEFAATDPDLRVDLTAEEASAEALSAAATRALVRVIAANPSGIVSMSRDVPGLVETSNNLGVVRTTADGVEMINCARSTIGSAIESVRSSLTALHGLADGVVELDDAYPGWQPDLSSGLLKLAQQVHVDLFGADAEIKAVHAGLECGLIGQHFPEMEMISIGPDIHGAHSPDERVSVPSSQVFYRFVKGILAAM